MPPPLPLLALSLLCFAFFGSWQTPVRGGDWPQVLGPQRDGHAEGETVAPWRQPPAIRWRAECGAGYSGVAVASGKVLLWHRLGDEEVLDCLSVKEGQRLWRAAFPAIYRGGVDADRGPRCVPVVADQRVFVYGAAGDLHAVALADGKTLWSRQLRTDYRGDDGYFGAGSTPIVVEDRVIAAVGGEAGAGLVAVDAATGQTLWTATDQEAAYASPVTARVGEKTYVVAVLRMATVMVDPASGEIVRQFDFGRRGPTVNAATPLVDGSELLVTAAYGVGCRKVDLADSPPTPLWESTDVISSQYASPVRVGGWLYAISGREDLGDAGLKCVSWSDGATAWEQPDYGTAHLIAAGERIVAQRVDGQLDLLAANPERLERLATAELPAGVYRSLPALSDGVLYCRRTQSATSGELIALELAP
ncbi:outer membrane protein assembly factor BamB family protein [Candidatus Laterigemmans baculatus]|uniref:outer membrane protein assembly factor BamB family protein n=1 Tax=Candidatus Laterigemmans baculatus TaxID=2770505 RepID=UPI0013DA9195|nr:PQQ-binding-like beta-propeller repeat protein [Candidatus Laterigemmans baculatus]